MAVIHLVGGEKGGVGKSLVARLLAQYMIDRSIKFQGFDADPSHGSLLRFYAGFAGPLQVGSYESLDAVVEASTQNPDQRTLVDLAARTLEPLAQWMEESELLDLAPELGLRVQFWHVMDTGKDSVDVLGHLLDRFATRLRYVLVRNELRGDEFGVLERSGEQERAQALGARVISIKRLQPGSMAKIDATSASFWSAASGERDAVGLGLLERQRVRAWLRHAYAQIESVGV
jgi:hypothetical protein